MSDIGENEVSNIQTPEIKEKPKHKKTPEQLENLAKGRLKRLEKLKKDKVEALQSKIRELEPVQEIEHDSVSEVNSSYTLVGGDFDNLESINKERGYKEVPEIKQPENENYQETKGLNFPELESFVYDCIDKYFERFGNTKKFMEDSKNKTPEQCESWMGTFQKLAPFMVALGVWQYPEIVGNVVEGVMGNITAPDQPFVTNTKATLTTEEQIEELEKNDPRSSGIGSVPIPKEQWKPSIVISEVSDSVSN